MKVKLLKKIRKKIKKVSIYKTFSELKPDNPNYNTFKEEWAKEVFIYLLILREQTFLKYFKYTRLGKKYGKTVLVLIYAQTDKYIENLNNLMKDND